MEQVSTSVRTNTRSGGLPLHFRRFFAWGSGLISERPQPHSKSTCSPRLPRLHRAACSQRRPPAKSCLVLPPKSISSDDCLRRPSLTTLMAGSTSASHFAMLREMLDSTAGSWAVVFKYVGFGLLFASFMRAAADFFDSMVTLRRAAFSLTVLPALPYFCTAVLGCGWVWAGLAELGVC